MDEKKIRVCQTCLKPLSDLPPEDHETYHCLECWDALCEAGAKEERRRSIAPVFHEMAKVVVAEHLARCPEVPIDRWLPFVWAAAAAILDYPETRKPAKPEFRQETEKSK